MRATEYGSCSFPSLVLPKLFSTRRTIGIVNLSRADLSEPNVKKAKLSARRKERIKLPDYNDVDSGSNIYHISEFLSHPSSIEAILNTRALQNFQSLDSNLYRCTLPKVQLLNFEVAPVLDLRVTPTNEDCVVELLSCKEKYLIARELLLLIGQQLLMVLYCSQSKFRGSEVLEQQNDHFSASMENYITWGTNDSEVFLDVDVKLNLILEIYTRPFTLLPTSAVEVPGNLMVQALVDKLVPLLIQQLLQDYEKWVQQQRE